MPEPTARPPKRRFVANWVGNEPNFRALELVVRATLLLNAADALFTMWWISTHQAVEANPLLADLAHGHPVGFVLVKTSLVSLGTLLLWRLRARPLAVISIFAAFLAYYFLLVYHLEALNPRLFARLLGWFSGG
jgi:hypothetical protein